MRPPSRRHILYAAAAGAALAAGGTWLAFKPKKPIPGGIVGANAARGHRLRQGGFGEAQPDGHHDVIIIGSGIAGLSAAYALNKAGVTDLRILELEDHIGGNSSSGRNAVSAYPWGAHYVPLLSEESVEARALFRDFGIITGDEKGLPVYNEDYILNDPDERLYVSGRWQDGLLTEIGASDDDRAQYERFLTQMDAFRHGRSPDGKRWFAIPVDESSADARARALDGMTMQAWMRGENYTSKSLYAYVDYGCRDDFGVPVDQISAYAGIHYFAGRNGLAANTHRESVLAWPEGNGFLVAKLAGPVRDRLTTGALVHAVTRTNDGVAVDYWDEAAQASRRLSGRAVVLATPQFIARRLTGGEPTGFTYAPWAVANITLSRLPEGTGAALAWDNVVLGSQTLGYVVATHQVPQMQPLKTVITYYWPLTHLAPADARKEALAHSYADWQGLFLGELFRIHPELVDAVENLDVWLWGHAMVRPVPGFVWGQARADALRQTPPIFTAHSDLSGMSIFEEALHHGLKAARAVREHLE